MQRTAHACHRRLRTAPATPSRKSHPRTDIGYIHLHMLSLRSRETECLPSQAHARLFHVLFARLRDYSAVQCSAVMRPSAARWRTPNYFRPVYSTTGEEGSKEYRIYHGRTIRHSETLSCAMFLHPAKGCAGRFVMGAGHGHERTLAACEISFM